MSLALRWGTLEVPSGQVRWSSGEIFPVANGWAGLWSLDAFSRYPVSLTPFDICICLFSNLLLLSDHRALNLVFWEMGLFRSTHPLLSFFLHWKDPLTLIALNCAPLGERVILVKFLLTTSVNLNLYFWASTLCCKNSVKLVLLQRLPSLWVSAQVSVLQLLPDCHQERLKLIYRILLVS